MGARAWRPACWLLGCGLNVDVARKRFSVPSITGLGQKMGRVIEASSHFD
jgi:hypothetical protein